MRRLALALSVLIGLSAPIAAKELQSDVTSRWLGAWVVVSLDTYSDCAGTYTNNRVNGPLVRSGGGWKFAAGELARVDKVDLKRSRLDVLLSLVEPVLAPYEDGPFRLYREASCRVELEVELPRSEVKGKDAPAIESRLLELLDRHANEASARASDRYNRRERDPYPTDYARTVRRHAVWRAEQDNAVVQARIDAAVEETAHAVQRVQDDPAYLTGFGDGVEAARHARLDNCAAMLAIDLAAIRATAAQARPGVESELAHGFGDGQLVAFGVELVRRLPECLVSVPSDDESDRRCDTAQGNEPR